MIPEGEGILVADDPREFAARVIRLLQDAEWRAEMARQARGAVEANYRWETQMAALDRVIASATSQANQAGRVQA